MDIRQSSFYAHYMQSIGWEIESIGKMNCFIKKLRPFSLIKIQRPTKLDLDKVDLFAKKYHALFIKIEPDINYPLSILNSQFKSDTWPLLPTKTLILNLDSISLDSLPKDTRYEIRQSLKNNLTMKQSSNVAMFYTLLQETMKIGGWSIPIQKEVTSLYQSFQPNYSALLFVQQCNNETLKQSPPIAACLLMWQGKTAHYMFAALTKEGRKLGAAYFLLWEAIQFCKKQGLTFLDLEGLYDDRYPKLTKNWQGFTKFKQGWGGKMVEYPGSFTKYYFPFLRFLFRYN